MTTDNANAIVTGLVSIVMPVFNGAVFLSQAITSVLDQEYPDWELIVIDDGSTDHSAEIIRSFAHHEPRIRYIYQQNAGQAAALNHGLNVMRGEFVTTLDADD